MNGRVKPVYVVLVILLLFSSSSISSADLIFKITADKYALTVGEEAVISIWAKIEEAQPEGNGLNGFALDMITLTDGVVQVSEDPVFIEPEPGFWDSGLTDWDSYNVDSTGNVYGLHAATSGSTDSNLGITGQFDELARVTIEAIGTPGQQVTYDLTDFTLTYGFMGFLRDDAGGPSYIWPGNVQFQGGNNVFTIVPEPGSLGIMAIMAGFALRRRKPGVGK